MRETRTKKQIDANKLDLEVFRVMVSLDRFAINHRDEPIREMSALIDGMRHRVRKHMHHKDSEATS